MAVRILTNLYELPEIQAFWHKWQANPNSDFEHFELVCRSRKELVHPYVLVVERGGQTCAILACRLERIMITCAIGYWIFARMPANVLTILHEGLIGTADEEIAQELISSITSILSSGAADAALFNHLNEQSPLLQALMIDKKARSRLSAPLWSLHRSMKIGNTSGLLLAAMKAKHRSYLKGREKKLFSDFKGQVYWAWLNKFGDMRELCANIEKVAALTYQRSLGAGFIDDDENRKRLELFASREILRMLLLQVEGKTRAYRIGILDGGTCFVSGTGYDPALGDYRPGTLSLIHMVDELSREGIANLDFGLGDADYKERFGDKSWKEVTAYLLAPSVRGTIIRLMLRLASFLDRCARGIVERMGLLNIVKTSWRRRLRDGKLNEEGE